MRKHMIALEVLLLGAAVTANGAVFSSETFDYSPGTALSTTAAGDGWSSGWKADAGLTTALDETFTSTVGSLTSDAFTSQGLSARGGRFEKEANAAVTMWRGLSRPIDWSKNSTTYFSALVSFSDMHETNGWVRLLLGDTNTRIGLVAAGDGTAPPEDRGKMNLLVRNGLADQATTVYTEGQTYMLVFKVDTVVTGTDTISLSLFGPSGELPDLEPATWEVSAGTDRSDTSAAIAFDSRGYLPGETAALDELRVGDSWEAVTSADPLTIMDFSVLNNIGRIVVDVPGNESQYYPQVSTDLRSDTWQFLPHSSDGTSPYVETNLSYSSTENSNVVLYVDASRETGFFRMRRPLSYYGHFWVEGIHGSHLDEVMDHSNVHWVEDLSGLRAAAAKGVQAIVQVRWQFFEGGEAPQQLHPYYEARWKDYADQIEPYIDHVAAFYAVDEPYLPTKQIAPEDLETSIAAMKERFPEIPVMVVFGTHSFGHQWFKERDDAVPPSADWIGFNRYNASFDHIVSSMYFLKSKLHPHQNMFLIPPAFLSNHVGVVAETDAELAQLNWQYYQLALTEPRVIGLLNYGLFTDVDDPNNIPLTREAQQTIGNLIINPAGSGN